MSDNEELSEGEQTEPPDLEVQHRVKLEDMKHMYVGQMMRNALQVAEEKGATQAMVWLGKIADFCHRGDFEATADINFTLACQVCPKQDKVSMENWQAHLRGHPHRRRLYRRSGDDYETETSLHEASMPCYKKFKDMEFEMAHGLPTYAGLLVWRRMSLDVLQPRDQATTIVKAALEEAYNDAALNQIRMRNLKQPELDQQRGLYGYGPDPWHEANYENQKNAMIHERNELMVQLAQRGLEVIHILRHSQETEEKKE